MSQLKFGKYKGKEVSEVAKDERGKGWLRWYLDQPINPKFKEQQEELHSEIRMELLKVTSLDEMVAEDTPNVMAVPVKEAPKSPDQEKLRRIKSLLAEIILMIDNMLVDEDLGWD